MLKKMRMRLILSAILAFFSVIVFVSVLVNGINYIVVTKQADETLGHIYEFESEERQRERPKDIKMEVPDRPEDFFDEEFDELPRELPPMAPFFGETNPESTYTTRFFAVQYDDNGEVLSVYTDKIVSVDEETALDYANRIYENGRKKGYVKNYRYLKVEENGTTTVIFLSMMQDLHDLRLLGLETTVVAIGSLLIVSVLVVIFSRGAIKPISNNIERQKQFITDASHELKTPLTSIMTSLDVLSMEYGDDEWIDNIRSQSNRMTKLVSGLVTLSRLDEENPLSNKESFSLSNAAWEIVEVYQTQAKGKGKKLSVDISEELTIVGDKNSIQQMMSVLLDNAIRYSTDKGDISFSVHKSRNKVTIEVINSCDYDDSIDVNRLFDRFYRPDNSRNANSGGTGIGLAIAKTVAETHGGGISAKCPKGKQMIIKVTMLRGKHL